MGPQHLRTTFGFILLLFMVGCTPKTFVFFQTDRWNTMFIRIVGEEFEFLSYNVMGVGNVEDQDTLLILHYQNSPRMQYQSTATLVEARDSSIELFAINTTNRFLAFKVRHGETFRNAYQQYITSSPGDTSTINILSDSTTIWISISGTMPFKKMITQPGRYELNLDLNTFGEEIIEQVGTRTFRVSRRTSDSIFLKNHRDEEYGYLLRVKGSDNTKHLNIMEWYPGLKIQTQPLTQDELLVPPKRGLLLDN